MADSGVDYWIYGQSGYEIELFHHTKTRVIFAMSDTEHKALAWYMFSAKLAPKQQSDFAQASWMDPKSEAPFAHHDVAVGPHHLFKHTIGLDKLVDAKLGNDATLTIDDKRQGKDFLYFDLQVKTKANGLVEFPFWMRKDKTPKAVNADIRGRLYFLETGPFSPDIFKRGPQSNAATAAIIGPVM